MGLLEEAIAENRRQLDENSEDYETQRQHEALCLALYKIDQLSSCVQKGRRILNDLCLLRAILSRDGVNRHKRLPVASEAGIVSVC